MKATLTECNILPFDGQCETEFDGESRLFGTCYLPEEWLEENEFSPFEFFVACVNLSVFGGNGLPQKGYLYFFAEAVNFNFKKMRAKVRYSECEPTACTEFNEDFFEEDETPFLIRAGEGDCDVCSAKGGEVVLLSVYKKYLPFDFSGEKLEFVVDENGLAELDFSRCRIR